MSKPKLLRSRPRTKRAPSLRTLRISPQKLNLVAQSIRGLSAEKAKNELRFSQKRIAKDVLKCLQSAIDNAENNHSLDLDGLVVAQAHVGKNIVMRRMHARARGRGVHIEKHLLADHHRAARHDQTARGRVMGQKVNPIGLRLGVNRTWDSRWYANSKDYARLLHEDIKIRKFLREKLKAAGVSKIIIERPLKKCRSRSRPPSPASSSARRAPTSKSSARTWPRCRRARKCT